jgi:excisionase family DNA binding protein
VLHATNYFNFSRRSRIRFLSAGQNVTAFKLEGIAMKGKLLTVKESAEQLGLSARTIWVWVYARKLGVVRLGRAVRIPQTAIDELIEAGSIPAKTR